MRDQRFVPIEGLRALAAVSVLCAHVYIHSQAHAGTLGASLDGWILPYLPSGLTLFFAISGFLLWMRFAAGVLDGQEVSFREYARRRFLRIAPAYWVILLLVGLVFGAAHLQGGHETGYLDAPWTLAADLLLIQNYVPDDVTTGIGPAWSLSVELVFYASLPLLALGARWLAPRIGPVRAVFAPAGLLLAIGLLVKWDAAHTFDHSRAAAETFGATWHAVLERSFLESADLFSFGMVAAVVLLLAQRKRLEVPRRAVGGAAGVVGLAAIVALHQGRMATYFDTLMSLAAALLLLYVTLPGREHSISRVLQLRPITYVGVISYSIYLWHEPLIFWLQSHGLTFEGRAGLLANAGVTLAVVIVLASITYRLVERPAMARKARVPVHSPTMEAAP